MAALAPMLPTPDAVSRIVLSNSRGEQYLHQQCLQGLRPAPGSVAPSLPTVPKIAQEDRGGDAARNLPEDVAWQPGLGKIPS